MAKREKRIEHPYGMVEIQSDHVTKWTFCDLLHRTDGPAVECSNGRKEYWRYGVRHCANGPAIIWADDDPSDDEYWVDGKRYDDKKAWQGAANLFKVREKRETEKNERQIKIQSGCA